MSRRGPEGKLQDKIVADLKANGFKVVKIIRCNLSGFPDLQIMKSTRHMFYIEVKKKGEVADDLQLLRHEELHILGWDSYVIDTWDGYQRLKNSYINYI